MLKAAKYAIPAGVALLAFGTSAGAVGAAGSARQAAAATHAPRPLFAVLHSPRSRTTNTVGAPTWSFSYSYSPRHVHGHLCRHQSNRWSVHDGAHLHHPDQDDSERLRPQPDQEAQQSQDRDREHHREPDLSKPRLQAGWHRCREHAVHRRLPASRALGNGQRAPDLSRTPGRPDRGAAADLRRALRGRRGGEGIWRQGDRRQHQLVRRQGAVADHDPQNPLGSPPHLPHHPDIPLG